MADMGSLRGPMPPLAADIAGGRRRGRRWPRVLGGLGLVLVLGLVGIGGYGLWIYANHDRIELIDDPEVIDVILPACETMTTAVKSTAVSTSAPAEERVASLRQQDLAVEAFIISVRSVGLDRIANDMPTQAWLDDWQRLVDAREVYADGLVSGKQKGWTVPTADEAPITTRMNSLDVCAVPTELISTP